MLDQKDRPIDKEKGRPLTMLEFMDVVRKFAATIPGGRTVLQDMSQGGFSPRAAAASRWSSTSGAATGTPWPSASRQIIDEMQKTGLVTDVDSDYQVGMPEVQVVPDRNRAADLGVSMADIGETVNSAIGGQRVGKFKDKGRRFDIRVRLLGHAARAARGHRRACSCARRRASLVPPARPGRRSSSSRRCRPSPARTASAPSPSSPTWPPAPPRPRPSTRSLEIARAQLPDGYRAAPSGSAQAFQESFDSLWFALVLGLIVAYMVLATQFNAFTHPFTVLLALPFSVSGALLALWLAGQSMNVYSMLGIILLMGIAKKNSIMLVDFTNQIREQGAERHEALLEACPIRLRPILMTSIATIAGALPPALALGPGAELQRPMALALVGGMIVSTAFTLLVVPSAYSLIDDAVVWNEERRKPPPPPI